MKKRLNIMLCLLFAMQVVGCSAFKPHTQPVKFTCEPKDGVVLVVNGQRYNCPVTVDAPRNRELSIEGYKDGYLPFKRTVSYHNNDTFFLDLIGGCIFAVPFIGLFTPGAKDLDETDIYVTLLNR
jgi:hypothetical protein